MDHLTEEITDEYKYVSIELASLTPLLELMGITDPEVLLTNALDLYHDLYVVLRSNPGREMRIYNNDADESHSFRSYYPTLSIKIEYSDE